MQKVVSKLVKMRKARDLVLHSVGKLKGTSNEIKELRALLYGYNVAKNEFIKEVKEDET